MVEGDPTFTLSKEALAPVVELRSPRIALSLNTKRWIGVSMLALPIVGATTGALIGLHNEHSSNSRDLRLAAGYERCLAFVRQMGNGTVTINSAELSTQTREDCNIEDMLATATASSSQNVDQANSYVAPLDAKITQNYSPEIQLPSEAALAAKIPVLESAARSTGITYPVAGGATGLVIGGLIGFFAGGSFLAYAMEPAPRPAAVAIPPM